MSDGYETLVNMAKPFLNNSKQITENDITDAVNTVSVMLKKRYDMTDEDNSAHNAFAEQMQQCNIALGIAHQSSEI